MISSRVFIGAGSNLGDKEDNINSAVNAIKKLSDTCVVKMSAIYQTSPVGKTDQDWFLNAVIEIRTQLIYADLLRALVDIEKSLGRVRREKWGERTIDLDILFYDDLIIDEEGITIPHPHLHERKFVLEPFSEIAPGFVHPVLKKTISALNDELTSDESVIKYK